MEVYICNIIANKIYVVMHIISYSMFYGSIYIILPSFV